MMNRIVMHHSGGRYAPNALDIKAYHGLVGGEGQRIAGKYPVLSNAPGRITKGRYAAHTWKLNTGAIGRAIAAMHQGQWAYPYRGPCPVKPVQVDELLRWVAEDAIEWGIPIEPEFILTHAEVQITLGVTQRNKWDFDYDPRARSKGRDPIAIGNELRQEIRRIMSNMKPARLAPVRDYPIRPTLRRGSTGPDVRSLQLLLGVTVDGSFGPETFAAVVAFQRRNELRPDGIVGPMTWATLQ